MKNWLIILVLSVCMSATAHTHDHNTDGMAQSVHSPYLIYRAGNPSFRPNAESVGVLAPSVSTGTRFNERYLNRQIAEWSLRQIHENLTLIDDAWVNEYFWQMTANMNANARNEGLFALPIIDDNDINAFAVPGGLIGLNTGTVLSALALDEVASVLAHEIAHISQRHYEHRQDEKGKMLALQLGGLLTAIIASSVSGDLATTALIGSQTAMAESMATHSREHEKEADRVGMMILTKSGYDARAMPRFFERLQKQSSLYHTKDAFIPSFIKSHPLTAERLSEATSRARTYPVVSMVAQEKQAREFDVLTWRLKYLTKKVDLTTLSASATDSVGARLALVSLLADTGQHDKAMALFERGGFDKSDPLVCITHAHALTKQGNHIQAVAVLTSCQAVYPERRDLRLHLAKALIDVGQGDKAVVILKPLTERTSHDVQAWQLTQRAYEKSTLNPTLASIYALHARSQAELWHGKYQGALQSNAQAIKLAKDNPSFNVLSMLENSKQVIITARDYKP
ncbi:M48 family metalloprotease [Moraxella oblonga]|uniref:M48 family metalloprotease n=1 Tax=Moraxella oblonga TaxID=200413 RepID=UPI000834722F|nr:M48 family metalloprotease [Moraxella oblonga]